MGKISERQWEKYKIWAVAALLTGACLSLYYFHVILEIGTIVTHLFYVPIILASIWWKRKGVVVALFSSAFLIFSHFFFRPDVATYNDYLRAFMFIVTAFVVSELSRRFAKEHEALQAANQQLSADEQQLKASNQQLRANEQQLHSEIAERKEAEKRVREQREFLRNTIESLGYPFYVIDANDKTIKMANSTAWQGKLPEKLTCYMLSHKQNKPCSGADHPCPLEDIKNTKQPVTVEHIHYDKDGSPRNIEVHGYPIFDNEQNVTQIIEYCLDITERKRAEEALWRSEEKFRKFFEDSPEYCYMISPDGRILDVSSSALTALGYKKEEIVGKPLLTTIYAPSSREKARALFEKWRNKGNLEDEELTIITKTGEERIVLISADAVKDANGKIIHSISVQRDITERKKAEQAIWASESEKKSILNAISDIVLFQDTDLAIRWGNEAAARSVGMTQRELVGCYCYELWHGRSEPCERCPVLRVIETGSHTEGIMTTPNGKSWEIIGEPVCDRDGEIRGAIEIARDITERKKAENALQESEQRLKVLFESAPDAIYLNDLKGNIVDGNRAAEEMTGYKREELIGKNITESGLLSPEQVPKVIARLEKNAMGIPVGSEEFTLKRKDGSYVTVEVRTFPVRIGNQTLSLGIARDISAHKKAEETIREERDRAQKYLDVAAVIFVVLDANGRVTLINNRGCEILGYEEEDVIGKNWFDNFLPEGVRKEVKAVFKKLTTGNLEPVRYFENPILTKDGDERIIAWHNTLLKTEQGDIIGTLSSGEDITERKQAEEALRESENSYRAVVENAVEGIVVAQGQMLQFVNPSLVSIFGYSEKELLTRPFIEFVHPDHREWAMGIHIKRLKGEEVPPVYEFKAIDKKGNTKWLENSGILIEWRDRPATLNFLRDITERKKAQEALKYRIEFERLITMLSKRFIDPGDIDEKIDQALKAIGQFAKVDRAYIFQLRDDNRTVDNTHEWCAEGIEPQIKNLKGITLDDELPWFWEKMKAHETFHVPVVSDLPPEANLEKKHFERQDIQALVVVPMLSKGVLKGFLGFDSMCAQKTWAEDIITLLRISGENISLALDREHAEQRARLLSSTVEQSSEGIGVIDFQGNLLFLNNAFAVMHGYAPEELVGSHVSVFHTPEQMPSVEAANRQLQETGKFDGEIWHVRRDGTVFPCLMHNSLLRDETGNPIGMIGTLRDITESKKAEQALKESEIKFRSLTEESLIGVYLVQDELFKYVNPKFAETFGYSMDELIDKMCLEEIVFPKDWPLVKENLWRKMAGEIKSIQYNFRGSTKDKEVIDVEVYGSATQYQGRPAVIGTLLDVTERKRAKKALQESELKFKTIFENAGGAIFIADMKTGEILECNSQAEQLLGRPRAEIVGMHQSEIHPKGKEEKYKKKFATHVQKGRVIDFEGEVQHKNGRRRPVWIAAQCLKIGDRDIILGLFMDTTERKKAERKLIENRAKLKSLASQLSLIEERERHRLATELHDQIGQSLVISKTKLDSLRKSISSSESTEVLKDVSACLGQIIQDTRTLTFDLSSPILYELGFKAAVAEWLDEQIREKHGIKTEFEDDGQPKPLDDDIRVLLFRDVRELLINVVRHANAKNIKVSIWKMDKNICVRVEDDGVGFDVTEVESMVTKKAKFGLFSIQERLESVGGRFEIESEPGHGSRITMVAPLKSK